VTEYFAVNDGIGFCLLLSFDIGETQNRNSQTSRHDATTIVLRLVDAIGLIEKSQVDCGGYAGLITQGVAIRGVAFDRRARQAEQRSVVLDLELVGQWSGADCVHGLDAKREPLNSFLESAWQKLVHNFVEGTAPVIAVITGPSGAATRPSNLITRAT